MSHVARLVGDASAIVGAMHALRTLSVLAALFASPAAAQSVCHSLNDTPTFLDSVFTGTAWFAIQFDAPADMSVTRIELFTGEVSAVHQLDLWSHDITTAKPGVNLGSGAFPIALANDWQGADLAAPVALSESDTYWIVWRAALGAQASLDLPAAQPGPWWTISVDAGQSWVNPVQSNDRQWKFRLRGTCCDAPVAYCTAGVTSGGCSAVLASIGQASASAANGFVVSASGVDGQRQGLFFYGLAGEQALAWGASSSFLCVKPPTQRTLLQSSGGSPGACDGAFSLDWNTFRAANAGALGAPFSGGEQVWMQAWFRDPPSAKTTSLSDALRFTVCL